MDKVLHTGLSGNGFSQSRVNEERLEGALREAKMPLGRTLIVRAVARIAGVEWTPLTYDDLQGAAGLRSSRSVVVHLPVVLEDKWVERRPDPRGGKSFEYRTARRFHERRPKTL